MKEGLTIISQRKFCIKILQHTTSPEPYIAETRTLLSHETNSHCNEDSTAAEEMRRPSVACHSYQVLLNWLITDFDTDIPHWIWCVCVCVCALARLQNSFTSLWRSNIVYSECHLLRLLRKCAPVWNTNSLTITFIYHHKACAIKIYFFFV
jgi:hypothetical protein